MTSLIYVADPMCSWCYGFGPELTSLMQGLPEIPVEIVVGGLRVYQEKPVDAEHKKVLREHWQRVKESSGLPFSDDLLQREDFVYDTEPACRAVVTARGISAQAALPVFNAIQHAFYAEGRDVTRPGVLAEIASQVLTQTGTPTDAKTFEEKWADGATVAATQSEFMQVRRWGIDGFPTLVLARGAKLDLVTSGFVQMPMLVEKLQAIVDQDAQPDTTSAS